MAAKYPEAMVLGIRAEIAGMRQFNAIAPVSGTRFDIPAGDRLINVVYYPAPQPGAPLILGFHGGGYAFGGNAMDDAMWSTMSKELGMNIASIGYRKTPEYPFPAALEDAYEALLYFQAHGAEHGCDPVKILTMGCSAGANLAAVLCLYAKRMGNAGICRQILMYPFLDTATDPDAKGPGSLAGPIMYLFNDWFCPDESQRTEPLVSPVFASKEDLTGLPTAIFCMADVDNLKAEGYRYAELLKDAGVPVSAAMMPDMPHGFFEYGFGEVNPENMGFLDQPTQQLILSGAAAGAAQQALAYVKEHLGEL